MTCDNNLVNFRSLGLSRVVFSISMWEEKRIVSGIGDT